MKLNFTSQISLLTHELLGDLGTVSPCYVLHKHSAQQLQRYIKYNKSYPRLNSEMISKQDKMYRSLQSH